MSRASHNRPDGITGHPHVVATALECMANTIANLITYNVRLTELLAENPTVRAGVGGFAGLQAAHDQHAPLVGRVGPPIVSLAEADAPLDAGLDEVRAGILGGPPGLLGRHKRVRPAGEVVKSDEQADPS